MPRFTTGKVPKYRHFKARNLACCDIDGKRYYLGPWRSKASYLEYDRLIAEWLANGRVIPRDNETERLTVVELIAKYLEHARGYYRKAGKLTQEYGCIVSALRPLKALYGRQTADEFGPLKLKSVRQQFIDNGLSRYSANKHTGRVRRMFKWAVAEQLVPGWIYQDLLAVDGLKAGRTEAPEGKPVLPVPEGDVQAVLSRLPAVVADMVRFQRATGCRPEEVCTVRPSDIDRSGDVWLYRPGSHKTEHHGRERIVFIGPKGQSIISPYLLRAADMYCFSPQDSERRRRAEQHANRKTPLSCGNKPGNNRTSKPKRTARDSYDTDSYRRAIHRACDKAGIARWSPNRLRHSAATEIRSKFGLEAAQVILGHSKADVTQVYAERDAKLAAEVAAAIG